MSSKYAFEAHKTGIKSENKAMHLYEYLWHRDIKIIESRDSFVHLLMQLQEFNQEIEKSRSFSRTN